MIDSLMRGHEKRAAAVFVCVCVESAAKIIIEHSHTIEFTKL